MGVYVRGDIHGKFDEILSFRDKMQLKTDRRDVCLSGM